MKGLVVGAAVALCGVVAWALMVRGGDRAETRFLGAPVLSSEGTDGDDDTGALATAKGSNRQAKRLRAPGSESSVRGTVRDLLGQPISDASVSAFCGWDEVLSVETDSDGAYQVIAVATDCRLELIVVADGFRAASRVIGLLDRRAAEEDFVLAEGSHLDVECLWKDDGVACSEARVEVSTVGQGLLALRSHMWNGALPGVTDSAGRSTVHGLAASGLARLHVSPPGLDNWYSETFELGESARRTVRVPRPCVLKLHVDAPIALLERMALAIDWQTGPRYPQALAPVRPDPTASLSGLSRGDAGAVVAYVEGYEPHELGHFEVSALHQDARFRVDRPIEPMLPRGEYAYVVSSADGRFSSGSLDTDTDASVNVVFRQTCVVQGTATPWSARVGFVQYSSPPGPGSLMKPVPVAADGTFEIVGLNPGPADLSVVHSASSNDLSRSVSPVRLWLEPGRIHSEVITLAGAGELGAVQCVGHESIEHLEILNAQGGRVFSGRVANGVTLELPAGRYSVAGFLVRRFSNQSGPDYSSGHRVTLDVEPGRATTYALRAPD